MARRTHVSGDFISGVADFAETFRDLLINGREFLGFSYRLIERANIFVNVSDEILDSWRQFIGH